MDAGAGLAMERPKVSPELSSPTPHGIVVIQDGDGTDSYGLGGGCGSDISKPRVQG